MAKILLVEDDNNLREIYEARLQAEGYTIVSARDGEEALVVAKAEKPDLVISDVMMPKISGFEMLDILRNTDGLKDVKVIMLTALGQSDDQQRADKLGADRYLVKSQVTLEDIVKAAQELLSDGGAAAPAQQPAETPAPAAEPAPPADEKPAESTPAPAPAEPAKEEEVKPAPVEPAATEPANAAKQPLETPPAEPAKEEEAEVEAKIEDFVAGATTEPTPPVEPAASPPPAQPQTTDADDTASDDKLMANAVDALVADTEAQTTPPADEPGATASPEPAAPAPAEAPQPPAETSGQSTTPETPAANNDSVTVAHKKIIQPLDSKPDKDLDTLLAEEEAKAGTGGQVTPIAPSKIIVSDGNEPKNEPAGPPNPADPNNIAL